LEKKFARKVQFLKNICKFHSLRSSIQISCIYVVVPFGTDGFGSVRRAKYERTKEAKKKKMKKIKDNIAADEGQQLG